MQTTLSKSKVMSYLQCPKRLWLQTFKADVATQSGQSQLRMDAGTRAGEVARGLFPGGHLVAEPDTAAALAMTRHLLAADIRRPIYEAAFEFDGVLVFVDILVPEAGGWHLIEVKSATSVKEHYRSDAALQAWVARGAGVPVARVSIACIDGKFVYPGDGEYRGLFYLTDVSGSIDALQAQIEGQVADAKATLAGPQPQIEIGDHCFSPVDCPFFEHCRPPADQRPEHPVSDLPNARQLVAALKEQGYEDLRAVPPALLTDATHRRIHQAVLSGVPYVSDDVQHVVGAWAYPRYYLDFETIQFAVPIWVGTRPYQQIPFQWSCHVETAPGKLVQRAFLARGDTDPRREFARTLADLLGKTGTIIAYNAGFERSKMNELAREFPEYAHLLSAATNLVVDLLPVARRHFYHPDMHGSWSIKYVLPAIAPELSYAGMAVADGLMAQEAFMMLLSGGLAAHEAERKREDLLRYCEQDTLAMVRITHFLEGR